MIKKVIFPNLANRDAWIASVARSTPDGSTVLDVGAGSAPYKTLFSHCKYIAQDAAQLDEKKLRDRKFASLDIISEASSIPLKSETVDVIVCTEVLEHVPEPLKVFKEFARLLRPGGKAFVTAPLGSGLHQEPFHFYGGYTPHFYKYASNLSGLSVEEIIPNGDSVMHLRQWILWNSIELVKGAKRKQFFCVIVALFHLPISFVYFVSTYLTSLCVNDNRFTVGYHVVIRKIV
jgi:ubiquinone/menaquinone biosynthesis C-methylase UbiE